MMRYIEKASIEPSELLAFRKEGGPNCTYNDFPNKDALWTPLLEEQGYLCCYCMQRIDAREMKIEHLQCQSKHSDSQLKWRNMLASCKGGEGKRRSQQTCDTRKGDAELTIDPLNRAHISRLKYFADGEIRYSEHEGAEQRDLDITLNLNNRILKQQRIDVLLAFKTALRNELGFKKNWSDTKLKKKLKSLRTEQRLAAFLGIIEYWLEKQIRRRAART